MTYSTFSRCKYILFHEGLLSLLKQGKYAVKFFLDFGTYYLYEFDLTRHPKLLQIEPKIDCTQILISDVSKFDALVAQGYDFRMKSFRSKLEKGALVLCAFSGKSLAAEDWVATSFGAKQEIDCLPYSVNFENNEVCFGNAFTQPDFRGKKLNQYLFNGMLNYLTQTQYTKGYATTNVRNKISQMSHSSPIRRAIGKGLYIKFLAWHYWKVEAVEES